VLNPRADPRMSFAAAERAANRVITNVDTHFKELKAKADRLDQQLTDISARVTKISDQLKEIEKSIKAIKERVV